VKPGQSFAEAVKAVIRDLKRGEVLTYGEVARRAGYPRAARAVGNILATNLGLPWWRVVRANGQLAAHSREEQARRLRREGVTVRDGRWQPPADPKRRTSKRQP
jgi:methylated-DNA-protein-cysteine methyltransferase related protein